MKTLLSILYCTFIFLSVGLAGETQPAFSFRWEDLECVRIIPYDDGQVGIEIKPKLEKAYELLKFTEAHQDEKVTILFGNTEFSHPVIRAKLSNLTVTAPNLDAAFTLIRQLQPKTSK
ncbi:MAG: hypothetical protein WCO68_00805 [Verrucomicrobiota bacterium]